MVEHLNTEKEEYISENSPVSAEEVAVLRQELKLVKKRNAELYSNYQQAFRDAQRYRSAYRAVNQSYYSIQQSSFWKITKPLRFLIDLIKRPFRQKILGRYITAGVRYLKSHGLKKTLSKVRKVLKKQRFKPKFDDAFPSHGELELQRSHVFPLKIKFSIVVPIYNTKNSFLEEMINSVYAQSYSNWELCMADGSDPHHTETSDKCQKYAEKDSRIHYVKLKKNLGISENTNACLKMATGDYIVLFDHDDLMHPSALYEVMKAICNQNADFIYTDEDTFTDTLKNRYNPNYKPDFSPDTLRSYNYICHLTTFKKSLLDEVGMFRKEFDGSQDYDMILRLIEKAERIVHIPKILYHWRAHKKSVAMNVDAKPYTLDAARAALESHLERVGYQGYVSNSLIPSTYKIDYILDSKPMISILIPNMNHKKTLKTCIDSIVSLTSYSNYEIIIIENNSTEQELFDYYEELQLDPRIGVVKWEGPFNYSAINNFGASCAKGEYLLLLNNDVEVITPEWLDEMLMFAQRSDVGAVGAKLYYPDDTVQHAGVIIGIGGVAGHMLKYFDRSDPGYVSRLMIAQNLSAVTAACLMVSRKKYMEVGGLDEKLQVAFNDVDFCLRIRKAGYLNVFTPYAELYHYESKSRGYEDTKEKQLRFKSEIDYFQERWGEFLKKGDPYYNPNLTLEKEDFSLAN